MTKGKTLAEHARDATGPYDLGADLSDSPFKRVDLALEEGSLVEWGSGSKGYGIVLEVNEATQQATVQVLVPNKDGLLTATGERKVSKDLDVLRPSSLKLAPDSVGGYESGVKKTGPGQASADTSFAEFSRRWLELTGEDLLRQPQRETDKERTRLSDDNLFRFQARLADMSGYEFGEARRKFQERHADLAAEPNADLSDAQLYRWGQEVLDGRDGRRRAMKNVKAARQEQLEYWRHQHELGRPLPRDVADEMLGS